MDLAEWSGNLQFVAICIFAALALRWLYKLLFEPLNRVRPLSTVGYIPFDGECQETVVRRVRENRLAGDLPPIYPNGWYGIMASRELRPGEAKPSHFCGQNVVVFRDAERTAYVLDAYCPHLGAHLGAGGRVVGNCVECPFHGWQFDGASGKCTSIPYTDRIPEQAKVRSWSVCEVNKWIFVWYDAEDRDPSWSVPEVPGIASGQMTYRARTEHFMNGHIEEVPLNGADVVHLKVVHLPFVASGVDLSTIWQKFKFLAHKFDASWQQNENPGERHIGEVTLTHQLHVFGYSVPFAAFDFKIRQIGPAYVTLEFTTMFGKVVMLQCLVPVEPLVQRIIHEAYAPWTVPTFLVKIAMLSEALQVERDLMIWNNKKYQSKPLLVKSTEDSLLVKNRRWYSQFYSEHSPRLIVQPRVRFGKRKDSSDEADATIANGNVPENQNGGLHNRQNKTNEW